MAFWLATVSPFLRSPLLPFAWPAGYKMEQELAALGIATAADLRVLPRPQLHQGQLPPRLHSLLRCPLLLAQCSASATGSSASASTNTTTTTTTRRRRHRCRCLLRKRQLLL